MSAADGPSPYRLIVPSERVRAEVATWPPLTEEQLTRLAVILRPAALELQRRRARLNPGSDDGEG